MPTQHKVSVIIPTYNESRDIAECLKSLLTQDYPDLEIIVVDDGSTDATPQIINKYPVKFITQEHQGTGIARNRGASLSTGEILVFLDADMTFSKNFISKLIYPITSNGVIGTFSQEEKLINTSNHWARCWNLNRGLPIDKMHPDNYPSLQPVFRAILKSSFLSVGGFTPIGYDDDSTLSLKLHARAVAAPGAVFYHRNPDSFSEVWSQGSWSARRKYKLGVIGKFITLVRVSLPISIILSLVNSIRYQEPFFLLFKPILDTAIFISLLKSFVVKFNYK